MQPTTKQVPNYYEIILNHIIWSLITKLSITEPQTSINFIYSLETEYFKF